LDVAARPTAKTKAETAASKGSRITIADVKILKISFQLALKHYFTCTTTKTDPNRAGFTHFRVFSCENNDIRHKTPANRLIANTIASQTTNKNDLVDQAQRKTFNFSQILKSRHQCMRFKRSI
jgi:hypothetical protein